MKYKQKNIIMKNKVSLFIIEYYAEIKSCVLFIKPSSGQC